jgi:hypothetical protein
VQDLYATTFILASEDGSDPGEVGAARAREWLEQKVGRVVALGEPGSGEERTNGWLVRWAHRRGEDGEAVAIDAVLEHPDTRDPNQRWRTSLVLSRLHGATRVTVRLSRGATTHVLRPRRFEARPPRLVGDLVAAPLRGYAGALQVDAAPRPLHVGEVHGFVDDVLRHEERALPVLLCDAGATGALASGEIAERLVGLAHVVVLHSAEAWAALRHELPREYVPYGGARLYWPGFGTAGDRLRHPYYTRAQLAQRPLERQVVRWLMSLSVSQVPRDLLPDRLRLAERRSVPAPTALTTTDDAQVAALRSQITQLEDDLLSAWEERERLEGDLREESRLRATAEANVVAVKRYERDEDDEDLEEEPLPTPEEWGDNFLAAVDALESPALAFTPRARACACKNKYPRPPDMHAALVQLEEIARLYHDGEGSVGGDLVQVSYLRNGIRIALQDDSYLERDRRFEFEGRQLDRLPHVKLDDYVAPTEVGRIYFALDKDASQMVVDWFGVKQDRPMN